MSVFNALSAAIYTKLQTTSALTALLSGTTAIYNTQAPDNAALPYVVFSVQGGGDENRTPNRTKNLVLNVRGYTAAGPAAAGTIDSKIDSALHGVTLSVSGWTNFWTAREQDIAAVEIDDANQKTWMAGELYRIRLDQN